MTRRSLAVLTLRAPTHPGAAVGAGVGGADERERHTVNNPMLLADLRAKVEALDWWIDDQHAIDPISTAVILRSDVLALIDGSSDG